MSLAPEVYPADAVHVALEAFRDQVSAEVMHRASGPENGTMVLALACHPGAPPTAIDELLSAMLEHALEAHLGRTSAAPRLPRGL